MALGLVRFAPGYIDAAAIRLPTGNAGRVMLVGIGDALVVLLTKLVFISIRIGIATAPELFYETFALVVGFELLERLALFISDDVRDVLVQPILVSLFQFRLHVARLFRRVLNFFVLLLRQSRGHGKSERY